ncbi:hypothetical protein AMJ85_05250 [candidate division BRC1 bacterium SM23_51]|nr:MAG: hypothetical protein AMJ85_05250 [candidate division BRC1 bacterium SM23_51]
MGQRLTVERDPGRPALLRTVRDSCGNSLSFETDSQGLVERVTSSDGQSVVYDYREGVLVGSKTDNGRGSRYGYSASQCLAEIALGNGSRLAIRSDEQGRVVALSGQGIVPRTYGYSQPERGRETPAEVARTNGLDNIVRWRVFAGRRRIEMLPEPQATAVLENSARAQPERLSLGESLTWLWKYDSLGRMSEIQEPQSETTRFAYSDDPLQPVRIERADGSMIRFNLDQKQRSLAMSVGNLRPWRWEFDKSGRVLRFEDFFHNSHKLAYDAKGRVSSLSEPSGAETRIGRDDKGRIVSVGRRGGAAIHFSRDPSGRIRHIEDGVESLWLEYNDADNVTGLFGSQGYARRFYYTPDGLPSTIQKTGKQLVRLFYDGELNLIALRRADRTGFHLTRGPGTRVRLLDAAGLARWTVSYDPWGRPVGYRKQGHEQTRLEYGATGQLRSIEAPSGSRLAFSYSPTGRLVALDLPLRRFRFSFDSVGQLQALAELTAAKRDAFHYDETNRLLRRDAPGWTEQYDYDRSGHLTRLSVRGLVSHEYAFRHDEAGWLKAIVYPNGVRTTFEYDKAHRLARASTRNAGGETLFATSVDYATSSRLAVATWNGTGRFAYQYDSNLALVETIHPGGRRDSFVYDSLGNLFLGRRGGRREVFRHDSLGRPTEIGPTRYVYLGPTDRLPPMTTLTVCLVLDDRERVVALQRGDGLRAQYGYLPDGRMISRQVNGRRVLSFDWDGPRLRTVFDAHGRLLVGIHYDPTFGLPLAVLMEKRTYFCHPDVFGHPAWLTNEKGEVVNPPDDFPFEIRDRAQPPLEPTWEGLPPAIRLPEEGLHLVRGHLCEPRSGDLLSPDLSQFLRSENPYRARRVARPIEPTRAGQKLATVIQWVEQIQGSRFEHRWDDGPGGGDRLSMLLAQVRRPEDFETHLLQTAFQHDFNPDRWFDPTFLSMRTQRQGLPGGPLDLPSTPADQYRDFSPLGPIPHDGSFMAQPLSALARAP